MISKRTKRRELRQSNPEIRRSLGFLVAASPCPTRAREADFFTVVFYGLKSFGCKTARFCAIHCESGVTNYVPAQVGSGRFAIARRHPNDERAPETLTNCIHEKYSIFEFTCGDSPICSFSQVKRSKFQGNDYLNTAPAVFGKNSTLPQFGVALSFEITCSTSF